MRTVTPPLALFALIFGSFGLAAADPPATPQPTPESAPQDVTVPSLPGQPNREGTVTPQGGMPMDSEGYALTKPLSTNTGQPRPTPQPAAKAAGAPGTAAGSQGTAPVPDIPVGPAPSGKGVTTGANWATMRGVVTSFEAGKSVTVKLQRTGAEETYTFAPGASVPGDIKPGETVRLRVLLAVKGKVADRVERIVKK